MVLNRRDALEARLRREYGLSLDRGGARRSIDRFLESRAKELSLDDPGVVLDRLVEGDPDEIDRLLRAVTVPHSWFHRDPDQWRLVEAWMRERGVGRTLDVWVPACATGEDAYTVALLALRTRVPVRVLATDIHGGALATAERAIYGTWAARELPADLKARLVERDDGRLEVPEDVRGQVSFARHNLMDVPPPSANGAGWDLILCRNVLFYFPQPTAADVVTRLAGSLSEQGRLMLGASDMLHATPPGCRALRVGARLVIERDDTHRKAPAKREPPPTPKPVPRRAAPRPTPPAPPRPVESDGLDAVERFVRGVGALSTGDLEGALTHLRAALFLRPGLWPAAVYLGITHERAGQRAEAERYFARAASSGAPSDELAGLPEDLRAYGHELAALARSKSRRRTA